MEKPQYGDGQQNKTKQKSQWERVKHALRNELTLSSYLKSISIPLQKDV